MSDVEKRQERLLAAMAEQGLGAMLVTDLVNVRYLTGYVGSNGTAVLAPERRLLFTDSRYVVAARAQTRGVDVVEAGRDLHERIVGALAEIAPGGRVAFEADQVTVSRHRRLAESLPGIELVPTSGLVEGLRVRKDPEEVALMREASELADRAFAAIADGLIDGRTEREVAWELEGIMRRAGAEGASFPIIVAGGAHGARPHAVPRPEPVPEGTLVVVDMGALVEGYASDCTRTFATGDIPPELERAYEVCLDAQRAAVAAVRPGMTCGELDAVARDRIQAAGLGEAFGHGLGHGVGLQIHERPWVRPGIEDVIETGMAVTIEPGIYLEGLGGVRIEDLVIVRDDGPEVLTSFPRELARVG